MPLLRFYRNGEHNRVPESSEKDRERVVFMNINLAFIL